MQTAIVTGASRGIGRTVARGLGRAGFNLAIVSRSKEDLESLAKEIQETSQESKQGQERLSQAITPKVLIYPVDIRNYKAIGALVSSVFMEFGSIDLLFNNAGMASFGTLEVSVEEFDEVLAVNLIAAFGFLQAIVPIMKEQGSGTIINVASRAGKTGFAGYGAYGASKFGLVGLSESLYRELTPQGIKVTTLCPSWVDTAMADTSGLPPQEMIQREDIFKTISWLLSLSPAACVREVVIECRGDID